jgi:hypothetical protein
MTMTADPTTTASTPRPERTPARLVTGTVLRFRHDKGFGFASIDGEQGEVFLHNSFGREVTGTKDEPKLTRIATKVTVVAGKPEDASRIIMLVAPGHKGLRAIAWGLLPQDNWTDGLFDTLKGFVNGEITSRRVGGRTFPGPEFSGSLMVMSVLDGNSLEIQLGDPKQRNSKGTYVPLTTPLLKLTYDLTTARPDTLPDGRYSILIREDDHERRITFHLPK